MPPLTHADLADLHDAVLSAGLATSRQGLLTGIDPGFVAGLPHANSPSAQILVDLGALGEAGGTLTDGSVPLVIWLSNAVRLAGKRSEGRIFERALAQCRVSVAQQEPSPPASTPSPRSAAPATGAVPEEGLAAVRGEVDFGIITLREEDLEAVLERFPRDGRVSGRRQYNLRRVELPGSESYRVAVARCIEPGLGEAQAIAHDILEDLDPRWLLVFGVATGVAFDELTLGDVVLSTRIHDFSVEAVLRDGASEYDLGGGPIHKDAAAFVANLSALKEELGDWSSAASIGVARPPLALDEASIHGDAAWRLRLQRSLERQAERRPLFKAGSIASSDRLVDDTELATLWLRMARRVLSIEMASAGVYRAAHGRQTPVLAIHGIGELVGLDRDPRWVSYACHTAAAFLGAFLKTRPFGPRSAESLTGQ